ncbi:MAG: hypothetical protein K6E11_00160 [Bacilli bacterium]|nr:hypothetical protein [Bacilli bacterium]
MKKKVLLVLLPALAMALGSCTGNSSDAADDDDEETSQVTPGGDIDPAEFGTKDSPLTIAQAKALLDKLDPEKTGETYLGQRVYVAGKVSANAEKADGKYSYAYIEDKTAGDFSINYFVLDSGITGDYSAKNSMKDKMVVASGFACIFKDSKGAYKYELTSPKDSEEQAKIESIRDPGVLPDFNPGTEAAPLTVSQAIDQIDNHTEARTSGTADMYIAGKVKSNNAWSKGTGYSNIDFVITDGAKDFTVFRATELPGYTTEQAEAIAANALVGMDAVVKAPAYYYSKSSIYETAANPDVLSLGFPAATSVEFKQESYDAYINAEVDLDNLVNLLPAGSVGTYEFDIPAGVGSFDSTTNVYTMPSSAQEFDVGVKLTGAAENADTLHFVVTVPEGDAITSITVSPASLTFTEGGDAQNLTAVTDPVSSESNHVEWAFVEGEDDDVVSLNYSANERVCVVTPLKAGTTKVIARVQENNDVKSSQISITVNEDLSKYGSLESPLTPAQALSLMAEECPNNDDVTKHVFYVRGVVTQDPTDKGSYWQNIYIGATVDAASADRVRAYTANKPAGVTTLIKGDTVTLCGYGTKYSGAYQMSTKNSTNVTVNNIARGTSTITVTGDEHATVTGLSATAENASEQTFTVTPDSGYEVSAVKVNGEIITPEAGSYSFVVTGNMTVALTIIEEGAVVVDPISLTAESLLGYDGSADVAYDTSYQNATVGGVAFTYQQIGAYKSNHAGLQFRNKLNTSGNNTKSNLNNTVEFDNAITSLDFTWHSTKSVSANSNVLKITFDTVSTFDSEGKEVIMLDTVADQKAYNVAPTGSSFKFVKIEIDDAFTYSCYWASIVINF